MEKKYRVNLAKADRAFLLSFLRGGDAPVRKTARAHLLLLADEGKKDASIAESLHLTPATVERIRKRYVQEGLNAALNERARPGASPKLSEKQAAHLIALACTDAPEGRECWTMQLLANRLVESEIVDEISDETVRRTLNKGAPNRGRRSSGVSRS